jgi:hypothetical protein
MDKKIKELAISDLGTTLMVLVEQVETLKNSLVQRSLIMDSQIIAHRELKDEMRTILEEMREELTQLRAERKICERLNRMSLPDENGSPEVGEKPKQGNQGNGRIKVNIVK